MRRPHSVSDLPEHLRTPPATADLDAVEAGLAAAFGQSVVTSISTACQRMGMTAEKMSDLTTRALMVAMGSNQFARRNWRSTEELQGDQQQAVRLLDETLAHANVLAETLERASAKRGRS